MQNQRGKQQKKSFWQKLQIAQRLKFDKPGVKYGNPYLQRAEGIE